jgi:uncharacterized protein YneF (UPF0154 family)
MHTDKRRKNFFQQFSGTPDGPRSLLQRIVTVTVAVAVFALALMFSVVLFAVVLTLGVVAWGYLWWKSRHLRRQMRENPPGGLVIEGEVIREVDTRDERER